MFKRVIFFFWGLDGREKAYVVQTLIRMMDVLFAIAGVTGLTEACYVGEDAEDILPGDGSKAGHEAKQKTGY